ncbi:pre-piRNA 3'-exonuclease trimmer [Plutella xylostella]|uniref:pre-piRNA 3'-exonuclease trimmer n=1 Tax=Plutella xylostella TaxID=51655 RepID=UPI002032BCB2|nr:pre-piRNA 3'-exonuclease trimmer [Plutella xylostella]
MEITKTNFESEFENISNNLKRSCFVGFDAEFTAILSGECFKHRLFDTNEERYSRLTNEVSQMIMTQVGLTMFQYERDTDTYVATGYTFHLSPQAFGDIDQSFIFQASTLNFLCKHNFDFNKFTYQGLPYLSKAEEHRVREKMKTNSLVNCLTQALDMDDERILKKHCSEVSVWLSQSEEETLYIDVDSPTLRYLLHNEIRTRHPNVLTTDSLGNSKKILIYRYKTIEGATSAPMSVLEENLLNNLLGFSRIISLLEKYQKPIAGHNLFLDLLLLHSQFIGPLPKKYKTFKANLNAIFPEVYDTKYISHQMGKFLTFDEVWKSNTLQELFEFFSERKCMKLEKGLNRVRLSTEFNLKQTYHEAGWDSYCAGYCFLRLAQWAAARCSGAHKPASPAEAFAALRPHCHKVNVIRAAVPYMNLVGDDPESHRPDLLYIRAVKERAINVGKVAALLAGCGSVDVKPCGARAALVATNSAFTATKILKQFRDNKEYRVTHYNAYRHSTLGRMTLWSGAVITGGLALYFIHKKINS